MPLVRKSQVAAKVETIPGVEATGLIGTDVVEVKNARYTQSRSLIERQPADPSLSNVIEGIGRGEASMQFEVDVRGSGNVVAEPDWSKLVKACYHTTQVLLNMSLSGGGLTEALYPGDTITGATSGSTAIIAAYAAAGATTLKIAQLSASFTIAENIDSAQQGAGVGVVASDPLGGPDAGFEWKPISDRYMSFALTGAWTGGNPSVGEGVRIAASGSGQITGGGYVVIANSGSVCTIELAWGTIAASSTLTSYSGKTNSVHATPAFANVQGPSLTMLMNRDKFRRGVIGGRGSFRIDFEAGGIGTMAFDFKGRAKAADDVAFLSGTSLSAIVPPRFQGGIFIVGGAQIPIKSVAFDAGVQVVMRADGNSNEGDWGAEIVSRDPTLTFVVDQMPLVQFDFHSRWRDGQTIVIGFQLGTAAGNTISMAIPKAQIVNITDGDAEGIATFQVECKLRRNAAAGDDEYSLLMS